jgi:hypothetical protein
MKNRILFTLSLIGSLYFLNGCVKNNPLPVYLEIQPWTLEANGISTGENYPGELTQNLTDAWVYVDGKLVGVFELPCKVPILYSGDKEVTIYPTIRDNGISDTKRIYPFVEPFTQTYNLVAGQTTTIKPKTKYYSTAKFWIEDFESATIKIETDQTVSTADIIRESLSSISLTGSYGKVTLTSTDMYWTGFTDQLELPKGGKEIYLEIDFRNTNLLSTGVRSIDETLGTIKDNPNIGMPPQNPNTVRWKKIYIGLKEIVNYSGTANKFKQYLVAQLKDGSTVEAIYIDNIKVVHF